MYLFVVRISEEIRLESSDIRGGDIWMTSMHGLNMMIFV